MCEQQEVQGDCMKILVAEDDKVSRRLLVRTLQKWGHTVVEAEDGAQAWEYFQNDTFPMVITDWMMPNMDGIDLVRNIRSVPREEYVYIIMLTARAEKNDLIEGMEAGADDFLVKPVNNDELRVRLRAGERIVELEKKLSLRNEELEETNRRMRKDLEAAAKIQEALLPSAPPQNHRFKISWHFEPCDELAGDVLNYFQLDENNLGLYVLDVSGHGVAAALLAVTLSRLLSPVLDQSSIIKTRLENPPRYAITPPREVANQLNRRFQMDADTGQYFTMIYGVLNIKERTFQFVSAGHPPIILVPTHGEARQIQVPGLPIGFMENWEYTQDEIRLQSGDRFYMYSDGIIEARNKNEKMFTKDRLTRVLDEARSLSLDDSIQFVLQKLKDWTEQRPIDDDVTILGVEII